MSDFLKQIREDIEDYQNKYPNMANIHKDEWAFNFWVMDKLFSEDEDLIEEKIVDYNDKGIDCYIWHEDLKDLYIIQNKFYSEDTLLTSDYVLEFLNRPLTYLREGKYSHSQDLQTIYNKYSLDEDFSVYLQIYVTNNRCKTEKNTTQISDFNSKNKNVSACIYSLDDIEEKYYGEPLKDKKNLEFEINTLVKATILNINTEAYKMTQALDAKYVLTPVVNLFELYQKSIKNNYPIFDANIREYLGSTGPVNKRIMATLKDPKDRLNFFYYNNGITIIVDDMSSEETKNGKRSFKIYNPQIVNGAQTVSTINEVLSGLPQAIVEQDFKDTYVMLKILKIPRNDAGLVELKDNIVTYNNSQNAINQKTFVANSNEFKRIQSEFERRGLLVCIKQSDKNSYANKYKNPTPLLDLNRELLTKFGIEGKNKTKDFYIDLEKFLQVILAFCEGTQDAIQNKSKLLKVDSSQNKRVVEFIKDTNVTINSLIDLFLLYLRAEQEKSKSADGRTPIPLYLIYCFAHYECEDNPGNISNTLKTSDDVERILKLYKAAIKGYYNQWRKDNNDKDYNAMIKAPFDMKLMDSSKSMAESMM